MMVKTIIAALGRLPKPQPYVGVFLVGGYEKPSMLHGDFIWIERTRFMLFWRSTEVLLLRGALFCGFSGLFRMVTGQGSVKPFAPPLIPK
jgi:hypothetical protein